MNVSVRPSIVRAYPHQKLGEAIFSVDTWARRTKSHYLDTITMMLGGMAAENVLLGGYDDGSAGGPGTDLYEATKLAVSLECTFGMGHLMASRGDRRDCRLEDAACSDPMLMDRIDAVLREQCERAETIVAELGDICLELADTLARKHSLTGDDVRSAIRMGIGQRNSDVLRSRTDTREHRRA